MKRFLKISVLITLSLLLLCACLDLSEISVSTESAAESSIALETEESDLTSLPTDVSDISEPSTEESMPEVSEPEVSVSEVSVPEVSVPEVSVPEASVPEESEPEVNEPEISEPEVSEPEVSEPTTEPEESGFEIQFIDVGQADAALIICDGKTMLIDGGNAGDSNLLYSLLKKRGITKLNYVVATHAHEDHIGGLAGALNYASVETVYCPTSSHDTKVFGNFLSAVQKHGASITIPKASDSFKLGGADCKILAVNTDKSDINNTSIVLKITYGETSFMFTGDAERITEQEILNNGFDVKSNVLKVGHHGSESSTSYLWLREVMPEYAVISVGKGNTYGHPTEEVLSRLRDAEVKTFRTDLQGDIFCYSDGKTVSFSVTRNENADVFGNIGSNSTQQPDPEPTPEPEPEPEPETSEPEQSSATVYKTPTGKRYHLDPDCGGKNSTPTTLEYALSLGLTPCKKCAQ